MKVGDLVQTVRGYSMPGLVVKIEMVNGINKWAFVLWPDVGRSMETARDLYVVAQS